MLIKNAGRHLCDANTIPLLHTSYNTTSVHIWSKFPCRVILLWFIGFNYSSLNWKYRTVNTAIVTWLPAMLCLVLLSVYSHILGLNNFKTHSSEATYQKELVGRNVVVFSRTEVFHT